VGAFYSKQSKDPVFDWFQDATLPQRHRQEDRYAQTVKGLESITDALYARIGEKDISESELAAAGLAMAEDAFQVEGITPTDEALTKKTARWMDHFRRGATAKQSEVAGKIQKEIAGGAFLLSEDIELQAKQRKAIKDGDAYYLSKGQGKRKMLRYLSRTMGDTYEFKQVAAKIVNVNYDDLISPDFKISEDEEYNEILKKQLRYEIEQPRMGAPDKKEDLIDETWLQWFAGTLPMRFLGSGARMMNAFNASGWKELREQGYLEDVEKNYILPELETLNRLDEEQNITGRGRGQRAMPTKWILGKSVRRGHQMTYPDKKINPEYEKELEFRMKPGEIGRKRTGGLTPKQVKKGGYGTNFATKLSNAWKGATHLDELDPSAPQIGDELRRVKESFGKAAHRILQNMDPDDPRVSRYFGDTDEDRRVKAREMAVEMVGEPTSVPEYERIGTDDAGLYSEPDFKKLVDKLFQDYPVTKMMSDMLKMDFEGGLIADPEIFDIAHSVLIDPFWYIKPVAIAQAVSKSYGAAKVGKYGETVSNFAHVAEMTMDFPAGAARQAGELFVGVEKFKVAMDKTELSYQKISGLFRHFSRAEREYKDLGALRDDVGSMVRAADDAGHAASNELRQLGDGILVLLKKAKTEKDQKILHQVLSGEYKALFEGADASLRPSKAMKDLLANPKMGAVEQLRIITQDARQLGHLPAHLEDVPEKVRLLSDQFYKLAVKHGQMDTIKDGIVGLARYASNYIPRWLKHTEKIHDDMVSLGYADISDAAGHLIPKLHSKSKEITEALKKVIGPGEKATVERAGELGEELVRRYKNNREFQDSLIHSGQRALDTIEDAWRHKGLSEDQVSLLSDIKRRRDAVAALGAKTDIKAEQYFREIESVRRAIDGADFTGQISLTETSLRKVIKFATGKASKERKPLGDKYYWQKNPLRQYEAYIRDVSTRGKVSGEIKELGVAFGVDNVAGVLGNKSMIKISGKGIRGTPKQRATQIAAIEEILTTNNGIHMVALPNRMSKEVGKVLLEEGARLTDDAVVFVPKVVANRLHNMLMVTPTEKQTQLYKGIRTFRDYFVRPFNTWWRTKSTIMRSPAFFATTYFGAPGLSMLGLGVKAANPSLHKAAHATAIAAAMNGSDLAKGVTLVLPRSPTGEIAKVGDALEILERYGQLHQGAIKYGLDIAAGKGPLSIPANILSWSARKFRLTQAAQFSDNILKATLFLGHIKSLTNRKEIYKTLDFIEEYGHNFNRMAPFEKTFMRDLFTFYTWNRFILPHLARQTLKNPARLAIFEKTKDIIEYNNKHSAPVTGVGTPAWLWMQGGFTAQAHLQPNPGESGSHEYGVGVIEFPFASSSTLAGGFHGESPAHAQLAAAPRALMSMITGGDYGTGHIWEKPVRAPDLGELGSFDGVMDYLYDLNDSRVGREIISMSPIPFSGGFLNIIKLYHRAGMHPEAAEAFAKMKAGRDFMGLDHAAAWAVGAKGLSTPATIKAGPFTIPTLGAMRLYPVGPTKTAYRRQKQTFR